MLQFNHWYSFFESLRGALNEIQNKAYEGSLVHFLYCLKLSKISPTDLLIKKQALKQKLESGNQKTAYTGYINFIYLVYILFKTPTKLVKYVLLPSKYFNLFLVVLRSHENEIVYYFFIFI